jgi:RNA polymerase sigma factor (sigma-70 family)
MATDSALTGVGTSNVLQHAKLERDLNRVLAVQGPALARLAGAYTNTSGDRDDLIQEIAIAIWQALPRFRGECSERTFVFRIAHNRAISHLAQRSPRALSEDFEVRDPARGRRRRRCKGKRWIALPEPFAVCPYPIAK